MQFPTRLIAFTISIGVLTLLFHFMLPQILHEHVWYSYAYNALLALGTYFIFSKGIEKGGFDFPKYFMGASAIRLLFSAIVLLLYIIWAKSSLSYTKTQLIFAVSNFFVFYILFTVFEISTLLAKLRSH